jgi:hypothetical protein
VKKSLPLIAGAIIVPMLAATVAAFAAAGGATEAPVLTVPAAAASSSASAPVLEAPVQVATPPQGDDTPVTEREPVTVLADDPEAPTTTTTPEAPTMPVPPNEWKTPEPTTQPPASPIPSGGPVEMTISWDGLKCARSDAWSVQSDGVTKMMCPGSANP